MEFLGHIGIDLNMLLAQAVNFLILVFILRIVLYKPMLGMFKKREEAQKVLEKNSAEIEKMKQEAEAAYRAKLLDAEGRAQEITAKARKTADAFTDTTLEKNREYIDQMFLETKARIEGAKSELAKLNRKAITDTAFSLAGEFLSKKLQRELHADLVGEALYNFEELGSREEDIVFKDAVAVLTAFPLPGQSEKRLKNLAQKKFGKNIPIEIDIEPGLKAGLIIRWGGYELDGSLRGQLAQQRNQ